LTAQHVLSDIIAHYQELLNCNYSFWFYTRLSLPAADSGQQRLVCRFAPAHQTVIYTEWHIPDSY